jgi:hypothetical protein
MAINHNYATPQTLLLNQQESSHFNRVKNIKSPRMLNIKKGGTNLQNINS